MVWVGRCLYLLRDEANQSQAMCPCVVVLEKHESESPSFNENTARARGGRKGTWGEVDGTRTVSSD